MAVARPCLVLACVFGCKFSPPSGGPGDAADAMPDVPPDVPDAAEDVCMMWDPEHFDPCVVGGPLDPPPFDAAASPYTYDTTTSGGVLKDKDGLVVSMSDDVVMQPDNSAVALWNLSSLTLPQNVVINIIGSKPLIIASWDTMQIDGALDAGSHTAEIDGPAGIDATVQLGAGASSASCTTLAGGPGANGVATGGSGGGGGAGFYGTGASGSTGDAGSGNTAGGSGGMSLTPTVIRAGCAGGASGTAGAGAVVSPATSESKANPGSGGGALVLAVRNSLAVGANGRVVAGGGGGAGSPQGSACGGGGGGSGGYLGLDAPTIMVSGVVAANGGGGGGGSGFANQGNKGGDGGANDMRAPGGMAIPGLDCGERGGRGGAGAIISIDGETNTTVDGCGGGGGGGGAGHVLVWSGGFTASGIVSPVATVMP
ncbi:MAG TPA: hypothetical protein VIU61_06720 [Kofleriaceae bacterium]